VLVLGILQGILLAALASIVLLLARASQPHVAFLGRVPGTHIYSDIARHPENERLSGLIAVRPEASLIYVNAESVFAAILKRLSEQERSGIRLVVCDLSASPHIDLAGSQMLRDLSGHLAAKGIALRVIGAHGRVRDLLRADGLGDMVGGRNLSLDSLVSTSR
jgi:sulfate permease, SulP family